MRKDLLAIEGNNYSYTRGEHHPVYGMWPYTCGVRWLQVCLYLYHIVTLRNLNGTVWVVSIWLLMGLLQKELPTSKGCHVMNF